MPCQWKNFKNQLIFGKDMKDDKVGRFWDTVYSRTQVSVKENDSGDIYL